MKVIESKRFNRTGEVNDIVLFESDFDGTEDSDPTATVMVLVAQAIAYRNHVTTRNLFTTTAIRVEF